MSIRRRLFLGAFVLFAAYATLVTVRSVWGLAFPTVTEVAITEPVQVEAWVRTADGNVTGGQ